MADCVCLVRDDGDVTGPKWQALAADIVDRIRSGETPVGSTIPSYRDLPARYDTSLGTVKRAVEYLEEIGILKGVHGKGIYVVRVPVDDLDFAPAVAEDLSPRVEQVEKSVTDLQQTVSQLENALLDVYSRMGWPDPRDRSAERPRKPPRRRAAG